MSWFHAVVHDTPGTNAKMLCADLVGAAGSYTGEFEYLTSYTAAGYGAIWKSAATLATPGLETEVGFGADAVSNEYFKVHLHAAPCSSGGGGVSRSDPTLGAVCPALPWRCCV